MVILAHLMQSASSLPTDASALESAISALERDIKTLENSSVPWERALPWFTAVVALGVAMELWVIWRDRADDMHLWRRGVICWPPGRPSLAKFIVEIVSVLFVTGGIVGELWAGVEITQINGSLRAKGAELRSKSDQLLALVTQEAGDAAISAKNARKQADRAKDEADDVTEQAKALSQYVSVVAKNVNRRHLDGARFIQLMKGQPKASAEIWYEPNDDEVEMFASDMYGLLGKSGIGWEVTINPIPPNLNEHSFLHDLRNEARGANGLAYAAKTLSNNFDDPLRVLWNAVNLSLGGWGIGGAIMAANPRLPDSHFVMVVERHWPNVPVVEFAVPKHKAKKQNR